MVQIYCLPVESGTGYGPDLLFTCRIRNRLWSRSIFYLQNQEPGMVQIYCLPLELGTGYGLDLFFTCRIRNRLWSRYIVYLPVELGTGYGLDLLFTCRIRNRLWSRSIVYLQNQEPVMVQVDSLVSKQFRHILELAPFSVDLKKDKIRMIRLMYSVECRGST